MSVAIPVFNEESVLPELLQRVRNALDAVPGGPHQIVVVDDGSTDGTLQLLRREAAKDTSITAIVLSRNFGHQAALTAALEQITGEVAIVMDGDLQDPPEAFPQFIAKYREGNDVVYAQRVQRKEVWWLRFCYYLFYRLAGSLSETRLPLDAGDFGLMSRRVVEEIRRMPEQHRYLRGLRTWVGFRQAGVPVERAARYAGESKYSAVKLLKLAADGIFSFSIIPLRAAAILGLSAIALSATYVFYALYIKLATGKTPQGFTALIVAITFLSGIQLFFMGIIGEYVGRVFEATKSRPIYVVAETFGGQCESASSPGRGADPAKGRGSESV